MQTAPVASRSDRSLNQCFSHEIEVGSCKVERAIAMSQRPTEGVVDYPSRFISPPYSPFEASTGRRDSLPAFDAGMQVKTPLPRKSDPCR